MSTPKRKLSGAQNRRNNKFVKLSASATGCRPISGFFTSNEQEKNEESSNKSNIPTVPTARATGSDEPTPRLPTPEPLEILSDDPDSPESPASPPSKATALSATSRPVYNLSEQFRLPLNDFGFAAMRRKDPSVTFSREEKRRFIKEKEIWIPTAADEFPSSNHNIGGQLRPRQLKEKHLQDFPWLAVSRLPDYDGCWCIYCVLFCTAVLPNGQQFGRLVSVPLKSFKNLTGDSGVLTSHGRAAYHKVSEEKVASFIQSLSHPEAQIANKIDSGRLIQVNRNRALLAVVVETLQLCAAQNIALRGHRDDGRLVNSNQEDPPVISKENAGNFRHLLRYTIVFSPVIRK